jgi:hypothetical protein
VDDVDYVAFESKLAHRNPQRGNVNRGIKPAVNVTVKILYADASAGLPNLPADFWTAFPGDSTDTTHWKPIGAAKVIASLSPTEPAVLELDWSTPQSAADHSCLLVVTDCIDDPIPAASKVFDIGTLVPRETRGPEKPTHRQCPSVHCLLDSLPVLWRFKYSPRDRDLHSDRPRLEDGIGL